MAKLAPSLAAFRQWIYAKWPHHETNHDGWIGDAAHQATKSDHNPNSRGIVDAIDTDENGIHMPTLMVAAAMHPSTSYLIYEGKIYKARNLYVPERYTGTSNPHAGHCHTSIWQTVKAEQSKTPWNVTGWSTLHEGATGRAVSEAQMYLNVYGAELSVDGHFGPKTDKAVRAYQDKYNVAGGVDGIIGAHTEYSLKTNNFHRM